jgi:hypothetical protein
MAKLPAQSLFASFQNLSQDDKLIFLRKAAADLDRNQLDNFVRALAADNEPGFWHAIGPLVVPWAQEMTLKVVGWMLRDWKKKRNRKSATETIN